MRKILKLLSELSAGTVVDDLESAVDKVTTAVRAYERKGSVTLKIDVKPDDRSPDGLVFDVDVADKAPKQSRAPSVMYRTHDGHFTRYDPRQQQIPGTLTAVGEDDTPPEQVDDDAGGEAIKV